jgi:hypothetical protein
VLVKFVVSGTRLIILYEGKYLVELKGFCLNTLLHWTTSLSYFHISSFHDFLDLFSFFLIRCFFCLLLVYLGCAFAFFILFFYYEF